MDAPASTILHRPRRLTSTLAWLPLAATCAIVLASFVSGRALVSDGHAAATVGVNASIAADIYLDASACQPAAVAIGDLVPGTDPWKTAQDQSGQACAIDFGTTNNSGGTTLSMLEDPGAPASPTDAMKCVGGGCGSDSIADFDGPGEPGAGTSAFGAQLLSTGGIASAAWSTAPAVHDVRDVASTACTTSAVGTGTCAFTWGATAAATDASGAYQAQAQLVVLAN
jgi:hypothetical protein